MSYENMKGFAGACYDMNSVADLLDALEMKNADKRDCDDWDITSAEWKKTIMIALKNILVYKYGIPYLEAPDMRI